MRWVPDGRYPFWYVDRGEAWRWGNDCLDDQRRIHTKNNRIDCCVVLICWSTFLPCVVLPCFVVRIDVVGEVVYIVGAMDWFVAAESALAFASSFGRRVPVALVVFFFSSTSVVGPVVGCLHAQVVLDCARRLPVGV